MNRFNTHLRRTPTVAGLAANCLALLVAVLTGCGSGQIAQTSVQEPAVNGAAGTVNQVALRNVYIRAAQSSDFLQPGQTVQLVLVASNQSPDVPDKLVRITSDIGTVTLSGDTRLPPDGVLFIGPPEGQNIKALDVIEPAAAAKATVALNKPISNGFTYPFTFDFEKAGSTSIQVPISAGGEAPPEQTPAPTEHR